MAGQPKVSVTYANGNLLADIAVLDGIAGLVVTVATGGLINTPKLVKNLDDAIAQGFTIGVEPFAYKHIKEFYDEIAGNQDFYIMGVAETVTLATMCDNTNSTNGIKKLLDFAEGKIRLVGVARKPQVGYTPGTGFFDTDVATAITNSKVLAVARLALLQPVRIIIEGRIAVEGNGTIPASDGTNGYAGVLVGDTVSGVGAAVGLFLGRAVAYTAEIKVGKVANGPLTNPTAFVGTKAVAFPSALADSLQDAGYMTFVKHPFRAGFYFGKDKMCSTDDYRLLAYGRVIDKAAIIAAKVYIESLESEVIVVDGIIDAADIEYLKAKITQQVNAQMGNQISKFTPIIDPNQNIINTGKLKIKLKVTPLGYLGDIEVEIGLSAI
jgi:hypothetical protein